MAWLPPSAKPTAQVVTPLAPDTPTADVNSYHVAGSVDASGYFEIEYNDGVGAHPLSTSGAIYDCGPVADVFGRSGLTVSPRDLLYLQIEVEGPPPADLRAHLMLAEVAAIAPGESLGVYLDSNGTGIRAGMEYDIASTLTDGGNSGAFEATGRFVVGAMVGHSNGTQLRGESAGVYTAARAYVDSMSVPAVFGFSATDRLAIAISNRVGTGSGTKTARIRCKLALLQHVNAAADLGL